MTSHSDVHHLPIVPQALLHSATQYNYHVNKTHINSKFLHDQLSFLDNFYNFMEIKEQPLCFLSNICVCLVFRSHASLLGDSSADIYMLVLFINRTAN